MRLKARSTALPCAFLVLLLAGLGGCDNAVVHVTDSRWTTITMEAGQLPPDPAYPTTTLVEGQGARIKAGELVNLRISGQWLNADRTARLDEAWYWTGYLPDDFHHYGPTAPTTLGALLTGRHVGDRFAQDPQPQAGSPVFIHLMECPNRT